MTYNIRLDTEADKDNSWVHRREAVSSLVRFFSPDIVGMQEVRMHQLQQLAEDLGEYRFLGVGRDDGVAAGEFSPLAFLERRYDLVDHGTFWLSETPGSPSVGYDAAFPRLVTWARLKDRRSNAEILALNTHFDHVGVRARLEGAKMIRAFIAASHERCEATLLLGDFNAQPEEESYRLIVSGGQSPLVDSKSITKSAPYGPAGTFNGFDLFASEKSPIDHIFVDEGASVARHGVITQHEEGRLPSDHYPVIADFEPPQCAAR